jgi:hypothetical protein
MSWKSTCEVNVGESVVGLDFCKTRHQYERSVVWLWEKRSELLQLANANVIEMGRIISSIHSCATTREVTLPLKDLVLIHPVDNLNAILKTASRGRAALEAESVLAEAGVLSQELIANQPSLHKFESITGFYALNLRGDRGFMTFEGNGRVAALLWAFPVGHPLRSKLRVEVTEFLLPDEPGNCGADHILEDIHRLRKEMGTVEYSQMFPTSLKEDAMVRWAEALPEKLQLEKTKTNLFEAIDADKVKDKEGEIISRCCCPAAGYGFPLGCMYLNGYRNMTSLDSNLQLRPPTFGSFNYFAGKGWVCPGRGMHMYKTDADLAHCDLVKENLDLEKERRTQKVAS